MIVRPLGSCGCAARARAPRASVRPPSRRAQERRCPCRSASASDSSTTCGSARSRSAAAPWRSPGIQDVRGRETWHTVFTVQRRQLPLPGERSLRELDRHPHRQLAALPAGSARGQPRRRAHTSRSSPTARCSPRTARPSSRASATRSTTAPFIYFLRTIPLNVGETYTLRALLPPRSQSGDDPRAAARAHPRAGRRVRRDRRAADHQVEAASSPRTAAPRSGFRTTTIASCCR